MKKLIVVALAAMALSAIAPAFGQTRAQVCQSRADVAETYVRMLRAGKITASQFRANVPQSQRAAASDIVEAAEIMRTPSINTHALSTAALIQQYCLSGNGR